MCESPTPSRAGHPICIALLFSLLVFIIRQHHGAVPAPAVGKGRLVAFPLCARAFQARGHWGGHRARVPPIVLANFIILRHVHGASLEAPAVGKGRLVAIPLCARAFQARGHRGGTGPEYRHLLNCLALVVPPNAVLLEMCVFDNLRFFALDVTVGTSCCSHFPSVPGVGPGVGVCASPPSGQASWCSTFLRFRRHAFDGAGIGSPRNACVVVHNACSVLRCAATVSRLIARVGGVCELFPSRVRSYGMGIYLQSFCYLSCCLFETSIDFVIDLLCCIL